MGNEDSRNAHEAQSPATKEEKLRSGISFIINDYSMYFLKREVYEPIETILLDLRENSMVDKNQPFLKIRPHFIKLFLCRSHPFQMMKLLKLLFQYLEQLKGNKLLLRATHHQLMRATNVCYFLIFCLDITVARMIDSLATNTELDPQTKEIMNYIEEANSGNLYLVGNQIDKMQSQEREKISQIILKALETLIAVKRRAIAPSQSISKSLIIFEDSLFVLYARMHYNRFQEYGASNLSRNIMIGAYFLASGLNYSNPSIYQMAVLFLNQLLQIYPPSPQMQPENSLKPLPAYYFSNLPVAHSTSYYDFLMCNILCCLYSAYQVLSKLPKININRLMSLRLVQNLCKRLQKQLSPLTTYYLEELCVRTRQDQIQRAYLQEIVAILKQKSFGDSQIFSKFHAKNHPNYNIKLSNSQLKFTPAQLMQIVHHLEKDNNNQQFLICYGRFFSLKVMGYKQEGEYSEIHIWPQIIQFAINKTNQQQQIQQQQ